MRVIKGYDKLEYLSIAGLQRINKWHILQPHVGQAIQTRISAMAEAAIEDPDLQNADHLLGELFDNIREDGGIQYNINSGERKIQKEDLESYIKTYIVPYLAQLFL